MKSFIFFVIILATTLFFSCNSSSKEKNKTTDAEIDDTVYDAPGSNTFGDSLLLSIG